MNDYYQYYKSPLGWLKLHSDELRLKSVTFVEDSEILEQLPLPEILSQVIVQLDEYFEGNRILFNLTLDLEGTIFQKQVWQLVQQVNFGKTKNYGDIARELGSTRFSRAVGMANGKNPIPIIIPCHRIIGMNGRLTGYSGGLERKKWLLLHEQKCRGGVLW